MGGVVLNCWFLNWGPSFYVCNAKLILMVKVYENSLILNINMLWTLICYESESDSTVKDCFRNWNNSSVKWPDFESKIMKPFFIKLLKHHSNIWFHTMYSKCQWGVVVFGMPGSSVWILVQAIRFCLDVALNWLWNHVSPYNSCSQSQWPYIYVIYFEIKFIFDS